MIPMIAGYATAALAGGQWLFWRSFRDLRARQLIQNTPQSPIRSLAMGLVEVTGTVSQRSTLQAPFSGRPCAYWQIDIAAHNTKSGWSIVHRDASHQPFFLRDTTGLALVYPDGARCALPAGEEEECLGISLPDCYAAYLRDHHVGAASLWRLGRLRFRERILEDGQAAFVLGTAEPRSHAVDVSADDDVLAATGTDDPAAQRARRLRADDQAVRAVIRRGEREPTFIISLDSERSVASQLGLRAAGELVAGPALTLMGLGYWLHALRGSFTHHG